jgi:hypothetical protein
MNFDKGRKGIAYRVFIIKRKKKIPIFVAYKKEWRE